MIIEFSWWLINQKKSRDLVWSSFHMKYSFILWFYLIHLFFMYHVTQCIKIAFCQPTMTWKRHPMPVNKQNCSYNTRLLFSLLLLLLLFLFCCHPLHARIHMSLSLLSSVDDHYIQIYTRARERATTQYY